MAQKNFKVNNGLTTPNTTFLYDDGNIANTRTVNIAPSSSTTANYSLTLPVDDGTSGQVLTTDGGGILTWSSPAGTPTELVNGNSNVVVNANANITISSAGNANIVVVTGTGMEVSGNISGNSYNNPNFLTPFIDDTAWAYGSFANLTDVWLQAKIYGSGDNLHGFRILDTNGSTIPFKVDGTGNTTISQVVTSLIQNGNSNIILDANANVTISSNGQSNIVTVSSDSTNGLVSVTGNITANNFTTTGSTGNITGANVISANTFKANANVVFLGNNGTTTQQVAIQASTDPTFTANYTLTLPVDDGSSGQVLTTDGTGILSWSTPSSTSSFIANGNSNVNIPSANGNVNISAVGNANILVVTGTGANVTGTANITGNANIGGNLNVNETLYANGNISANGFIITPGGVDLDLLPATQLTRNYGNLDPYTGGYYLGGATRWTGVRANTGDFAADVTVSGNVNVTSNINGTTFQNGNSNVVITANANVTITANSNATMVITATGANITGTGNFSGNVSALNFLGNLVGPLANGNSNVNIPSANGNVNISAVGNANILVVTGTGANITGTANVSGNANVGNLGTDTAIITTGNITTINTGLIQDGNSNIAIASNANITIASNGVSNVVTVTKGNLITGNGVGFILTSNNGTAIRQVQLKTSTSSGFVGNYSLTLPVNSGFSGQALTTDGSGVLSWTSIDTSTISNGNSNVNIPVANGNVNISSAGNANIFVVTGTGTVTTGTAKVTDTLTALQAVFENGDGDSQYTQTQIAFGFTNTPNLKQYIHTRHSSGQAANNAIDFYTSDGNVTGVFPGNAILGLTVSDAKIGVNIADPTSTLHVDGNANITGNILAGANLTVTSNVSANIFKTIANGAFVALGNNGTTTQQVAIQASTDAGFTANYTLTLPVDDGTSGQYLQTDGTGILSWSSISTSSLVNGNSNVVVEANANVTISSTGNANVLVITGTGANIAGTANVSGNANVGNLGTATAVITTGNITTVNTGLVQNGNSNITITSNANVTITSNSNATMVITGTGANITGTSNISGDLRTGGNLTVSGTGITSIAGNIDMNGKWVGNIGYAVVDTDAASKLYVDQKVSSGISYHQPVNAATTTTLATATSGTTAYNSPNGAGNGIGAYISTTGTFTTIDGVTINGSTSVRILVKDEANAAWNGVYNYTNATAITRSTDADEYGSDSTEQLSINDYFFTLAGTVNNGTAFIVSAPAGTITFGTSNIIFSVFSTSQVYTGGTGITVSGTVISANAIQTQITQVGTLTSLSVSGNANVGNLIGPLANGNSNVNIPSANGNVNISVVGNANVLVVTGTGANITGTANISGNANVGNLGTATAVITTGNITTINSGLLQNGNSNIAIAANSNVTIASNGVSNVVTVTDGNLITGNGIGLILTSNNGTAIKQVQLKTSTDAGFTSNYSLTLPTTDGTTGQVLQTDGSGILTWADFSPNSLVNGNSNVVVNANANVTISAIGNANVVVVSGTDTYFGSNIQVGAINSNSGLVFNANTFQTKLFASNALTETYSIYLPTSAPSTNGLSLVANTDGTLSFTSIASYVAQPTIKFTAAANGNNQTFTNANIASFGNSTAFSSVYRNGVLVDSSDYSFSDTTLTMNVQLVTGDTIAVSSTNLAAPPSGGSYVAGSNTQVQFNDAGAFGGSGGLTYDKTQSLLTVGNLAFTGSNGNVTVAGNTWSFGTITGIPTLSLAQGGGNTYITAPPSNTITILTQNGGAAAGWSGIQLIDQGSVWIYVKNQTKNWEFTNTGNLNAPGNINVTGNVIANSKLLVGLNSTSLVNPVAVFSGSGATYDQVAVINTTGTGSADITTYGNNGDDTQSWTDMGFTGNTFNDANYTVTAAGDGYLFVQGNTSFGGNLVIATGNKGTTKDIIFATGGFLTGNIKARLYNANGLFSVTGNISAGNLIGPLANGNSNVNIPSANGNVNITAVGNTTLVITGTGANITGTANVSGNANVGNLGTATAIITTGNITTVNTGLVQNGNSNVAITANANVTITSRSNAVVVITGTGANITGTANISGNLAVGSNLAVVGTVTSTGNTNGTGFTVGNGAVSNVALGFSPTAGTAANMAIRDYSTVSSTIYFDATAGGSANGQFLFRGSSSFTQFAKIDGNGITLPTKPAIRVYGNNGTNIAGGTTLTATQGATVDFDTASNYVNSTGIFTAPAAGLYSAFLNCRVGSTSGLNQAGIFKNNDTTGANIVCFWENNGTTSGATHFGVSGHVKLAAGDTLRVKVISGNINFDGNDSWGIRFEG